jgi:hypothetical protein
MSASARFDRAPLKEFRDAVQSELIALKPGFSYYSAVDPFNEEDLRDYIEDPIAALPPAVASLLPQVILLLVPYVDPLNGKEKGQKEAHAPKSRSRRREPVTADQAALPPEGVVLFERPTDARYWRGVHWLEGPTRATGVIVLATADTEVADYHYQLYRHLAMITAELSPAETLAGYVGIIREELNSHMHGEVDERSWQLKQSYLRHRSQVRRDSREFREYAMQSFVDTLTLFLHGICCDIDVDTGPRQLPSRHLRRRLRLLRELFPPPQGYALFPEELDRLPAAAE